MFNYKIFTIAIKKAFQERAYTMYTIVKVFKWDTFKQKNKQDTTKGFIN